MSAAGSARHPVTRERIIEVALAIVDEDGAEGLTMRRLGQRLGVDPMTVYHHLPNKAAVLDGIVEHLWDGVELPPPAPGEGWQEVMVGVFTAFRARLLQHPRAAAIIGTRPSTTPALFRLIEVCLRRLEDAGLSGSDAMQLIDCLSAFTIGKVLAETSEVAGGHSESISVALGSLTPDSHPTLLGALAAGYRFAPEEEFGRGLRALVGGWRTDAP
ncbi:MAG: TetR/AcrR family transcriptional regulator C-terminal domain-containing protein [Propionicimonas sp.]